MTDTSEITYFISDLHLQPEMPETARAFLKFLDQFAARSKALYLLGDIFEYWAGDDGLVSPFPKQIASALSDLTKSGVPVFWIAGNRDFLVGAEFAKNTGVTILDDPFSFECGGKSFVISHGDHLCTDDLAYQRFRAEVRRAEWQQAFLTRSLAERKAIIAEMRKQSKQHQQQAEIIGDVNSDAVLNLFESSQSDVMIHGHTHRPNLHTIQLGSKQVQRYVLSDWDLDNTPTRGDWLSLHLDGTVQRYTIQEIK